MVHSRSMAWGLPHLPCSWIFAGWTNSMYPESVPSSLPGIRATPPYTPELAMLAKLAIIAQRNDEIPSHKGADWADDGL